MIKTIELECGITLVLEAIDFVKSVAIGVWIKNGSVDEKENDSGVSHFIEHMLFKGSKNRNAKEIANEMARIGGRINAFTAKEYTCYYAHTLTEHMDIAIDILSDMLTHPMFDEEEIKKEKNIVLEELAMAEDTPEDKVHDQLEEVVFKGSALAMDILGRKESIEDFNKEQIESYFDEHYVAKNITISIVGAFDEKVLETKITKAFIDISTGKSLIRNEKYRYKPTIVLGKKDIEQVHMILNFPTFGYKSDKSYALSILNTIIGGGINSKLFMGIREDKGLVYSIYSYVESYADIGTWNIYANFNPKQFEEIFLSIFEELDKFLIDGLVENKLAQVKEQIKSSLIIGYESMNNRMSGYGKSNLMLGHIRDQEELIQRIDRVTSEDIMELAKELIDINKMSVSIVGNLKNIDRERIINLCKR